MRSQSFEEKTGQRMAELPELFEKYHELEDAIRRKLRRLGMRYNLPDRVMRDIAAFSEEYNIQKVVLFGSRARGTHANRSDVDIAVSGGNFDSFYWAVKEKVHSLLSFDIIEWNGDVSEELKKEIEKDGIVIYEKA